MTSPYPPYQQPRKLERSRTNKVLGGVCGGVANYVNMDPTLVRVLTTFAAEPGRRPLGVGRRCSPGALLLPTAVCRG